MPHYKDAENKVHFIESEEFEHLLPEGSRQISDAAADILRAPTAEQIKAERIAAIDLELAEIDAKGARPSREITAALAAGEPLPAAAVQKITDLEAQAGPLRAERRLLTS